MDPATFCITGNMPGRCDAGRIWQKHNDRFLLGYGFRQTLTDRRLWVLRNQMGTLLLHDHVDDSRLSATTAAILSHFYRAWAAAFNSPPEPVELSENFWITPPPHRPAHHRGVLPGRPPLPG
jgi:hypothetical protein